MNYSFDRIAERYDETRAYPDHVMNIVIEVLDAVLSGDRTVLDAGAGTGRFAHPLQRLGYEVFGVDISPKMLSKARDKGTSNLVRGDLRRLPFRDEAFDSALCVHVLHLIRDWPGALYEISRVTKRRLTSIATDKQDSPTEEIRRVYEEACAELGHNICHPGLREKELTDIMPPSAVVYAGTSERTVEVQQMIDGVESRTLSSQWLVPEDVHKEAVHVLRERYKGVDSMISRERLSILVWDIPRLREIVSEQDVPADF